MRLVRDILLGVIALYIGLIIFMPKSQLYYKAEEFLNSKGVVIGNEKIVETILDFKILHPVAYYQGADIARVAKIDIKPLLLVNEVNLEDLELMGVAKKFIKVDIDSLKAKHNILKPYYIKLDINGSFGLANGYIDLKQRLLHIDITKPKDIKPIKRLLKKSTKGWKYEYRF